MKRLKAAVRGLAALLITASPAQAQGDMDVFEPNSAWALDYGDDNCRLMRDFKHGDEVIGLFLERTQPGASFRLIIVGNGVKLFRGANEIGFRMAPKGAPRVAQRQRSQTSDGQQYLNLGPTTFADMPAFVPGAPPTPSGPYTRAGEAAVAAGIEGIVIDRGLTHPVRIETGKLGDAASALQVCADDLLASWGLDAEKHMHLQRIAMPAKQTAGWLASDTIAFSDFSKLNGGNNEVRVMIDKAGKVNGCHIVWPTLDKATNEKVCEAVTRNGAFLPALDQSGQPIDSYWIASLFFLLPPFGGG